MRRSIKSRVDPTQQQRRRLLAKNACVCCVCERRYVGVHLHHIDGDNTNTVDDNLAVLCVQDHDAHHRPAAYDGPNHLELGATRIKRLKKSWEAFVADVRQPHPAVLAVLNIFGSLESIHSMKLVFQRVSGGIEFERTYHLHDGPPESWNNLALDELGWLSKKIDLTIINEPLAVEWCPCCRKRSLSRIVNKGLATKLTASSWETDSVATVYINPTRPSTAISVFLGRKIVYRGHLHLCHGRHLHYVCDDFEERKPVAKSRIKAEAARIIKKVLEDWEPASIWIGTGDPDNPSIISRLVLPDSWGGP